MNAATWWYVARATGLVAWALLSGSVLTGLLLSTRLAPGRPPPAWRLDLHRFLGGLALVSTALHLGALVADDHVTFGVLEIVVPFASPWRPGAVALGVLALFVLVAVELTSLAMKRLPRRAWRAVHGTSFLAFWLATFHLLTAGHDATHPATRLACTLVVVAVVFLTLVRLLSPKAGARRRVRPDRPAASAEPSLSR
jgi:methionine sulfoxide reductase heme-binding subunit